MPGGEIIRVRALEKSFKVAKRGAGVREAAKSLFKRRYELVRAVDGLTFSVSEGEIVGFIGPNGAGKSTAIKILCGILTPDGGACEALGYVPWKQRKDYVANIGVVFGQRTQLWWDVPVLDSFLLLKEIYRLSERSYRDSLDELTESLSLASLLHTPLRQLSLGQRMKCELAASLLHRPRLLFLDEPTIGLDATSKLEVRDFISRIRSARDVTVLLTTHDMSDIEALADRLLLVGKGRLLFGGTFEEMRAAQGETSDGDRALANLYRELGL